MRYESFQLCELVYSKLLKSIRTKVCGVVSSTATTIAEESVRQDVSNGGLSSALIPLPWSSVCVLRSRRPYLSVRFLDQTSSLGSFTPSS